MNVAAFQWLLIVVTKLIYFVEANWITGNLCWSMPCMNGGSCFGSAYTYLCVCAANYSGALCEKRLGICQESPCGNRGLCVETGLTSFECRCYFDYMGPLCEDHVPKNDPSVWSSLIPVHTRVLFDILQEAYRLKAQGRAAIHSNNSQINFPAILTTHNGGGSLFSAPVRSTTTLKSNLITDQNETTKEEHVIRAEGIQLENIFPEMSTLSTSDMFTQSFTTQTIEQNESNNEAKVSTNTTADKMAQITENISINFLPLTTVENMMTVSTEENSTNYLNTTEDQEFVNMTEQFNRKITSVSIEWSSDNSDNDTNLYTTEIMQNSTEQISSNNESKEFLMNAEAINSLSNQTDENQLNSSAQTITSILNTDSSIDTVNISQSAHNQLLIKLCQQLLSHILPNVSSLSSSAAVEAALSLSNGSSSYGNNSAEALLIWIKEQLISSSKTTTTSTSSPSLLINEKKISSISLQRVDMDDVLHEMNNNNDGEN